MEVREGLAEEPALLDGELGAIEGVRIVKTPSKALEAIMIGLALGAAGAPQGYDLIGPFSGAYPRGPKPKIENPELQLAAEEKRRRKLERNRRNLK